MAYLDKVDPAWFSVLRAAAREAGEIPRVQPIGVFDALVIAYRRDGYHGCALAAKAAAQMLVDNSCE